MQVFAGREEAGIADNVFSAAFVDEFEGYAGRSDDDVGLVFLPQPVFEDGAVECAQEAETPACAECFAAFFRNGDGAVVESDLVDAIFKMCVVALICWEGGDEDHALRFFEVRQWFDDILVADCGVCVANLGFFTPLHAGVEVDVAYLAGAEARLRRFERIHDANFANDVFIARGEGGESIACFDLALKDSSEDDDASVVVVPAVY